MNICVFVSVCLYICIRTVLCQMLYWHIFAFIFISICINIFVYLYLSISLSVSWYIFVRAECQCGPAEAAAAAAAVVRCSSDTFSGPGQAGFPPPFLFLLFVLFSVYCFLPTVSLVLFLEYCFLSPVSCLLFPTVSYCLVQKNSHFCSYCLSYSFPVYLMLFSQIHVNLRICDSSWWYFYLYETNVKLREAWHHQNRWIFGELPNGSWPSKTIKWN